MANSDTSNRGGARKGALTATATVVIGEKLTVVIAGDPSAGFEWILRVTPDVVSAIEATFRPAPSPGEAGMGGDGEAAFTFQGAKYGTGEIEFNYERPVGIEPPALTLTVGVTVVPAPSPAPLVSAYG